MNIHEEFGTQTPEALRTAKREMEKDCVDCPEPEDIVNENYCTNCGETDNFQYDRTTASGEHCHCSNCGEDLVFPEKKDYMDEIIEPTTSKMETVEMDFTNGALMIKGNLKTFVHSKIEYNIAIEQHYKLATKEEHESIYYEDKNLMKKAIVIICNWKKDNWNDDDNVYKTQCGNMFYFSTDDSPEEHQFKFCPFCGGSLKYAILLSDDIEKLME